MATQTPERIAAHRPRHRFTVDEYHRMIEARILTEDDRVELVDGEVLRLSAMGARHGACVGDLTESLAPLVAGRARLRVQLPITIPHYDEPEPDVVIARIRADRYRRGHPKPEDVLLVIEVSDTSLESDLREKLPVYARAGIPEAWIVNLPGRAIERYSDPDPASGVYRAVERFRPGQQIASVVLPSVVIPVAGILGVPGSDHPGQA